MNFTQSKTKNPGGPRTKKLSKDSKKRKRMPTKTEIADIRDAQMIGTIAMVIVLADMVGCRNHRSLTPMRKIAVGLKQPGRNNIEKPARSARPRRFAIIETGMRGTDD
jgi:hypothetical protein